MRAVLEWFSQTGHAAFAAFAVSVVAVGISAASLIVAVLSRRASGRVETRQLQIEEQRERDRVVETKKAQLTARIVKEPSRTGSLNYYLEVTNQGSGEARDIEVRLDGVRAMEHPSVLTRQKGGQAVGSRLLSSLHPDSLARRSASRGCRGHLD